jgi:hypothetical protein
MKAPWGFFCAWTGHGICRIRAPENEKTALRRFIRFFAGSAPVTNGERRGPFGLFA